MMGDKQSRCYLWAGVKPGMIVEKFVLCHSCDGKTKERNCWGSKLYSRQWRGNRTKFSFWLRGKHWGIRVQVKGGCLPGWVISSAKCVACTATPGEKQPAWGCLSHEGTNPKYQKHQPTMPSSLPLLLSLYPNQEVPSAAEVKGEKCGTRRETSQVSEPVVGKEKGFEMDNRLHFDWKYVYGKWDYAWKYLRKQSDLPTLPPYLEKGDWIQKVWRTMV